MARVYTDPFEICSFSESGWTGTFTVVSTNPRKFRGNGGSYSLRSPTGGFSATSQSPSFGTFRHLHFKVGLYMATSGSDWEVKLMDPSNVIEFRLASANLGAFNLYRGNSTLIATSTEGPKQATDHLIEVEIFQDNASGWIRVSMDAVEIISFTGDTLEGTGFLSKFATTGAASAYWDDIAVNSLTLDYDGGVGGLPIAGETITDATSSATAVISVVNGTATSGTLTIQGWDINLGNDWGDNNQVTSTGTFDALVNAPNAAYKNGLAPHSTAIGNGYITAHFPNANGTYSQLTGSDGDSVDNYLQVDDRATVAVPTTYVDALVANEKDTYKGNLSADLPAAVNEIVFVGLGLYAQSSLTGIDGVQPTLRMGGVDYDGDRNSLGSGNSIYVIPIPTDPSIVSTSDQSWVRSALASATFEYGQKFVA